MVTATRLQAPVGADLNTSPLALPGLHGWAAGSGCGLKTEGVTSPDISTDHWSTGARSSGHTAAAVSTAATGTVCHETARPRPPQLMATALPPRQPGHRPATITTSRHTLTPALATLVTTFWSRVRDQEGNNPPNLLLVLCWCCHGLCGGWWCEAGPGQSWDHVTTAASSHQQQPVP